MNLNQIRAELESRGYSFAIVADAVGVSRTYVHTVARTGRGSKRVQFALAKAIGKEISEVFSHPGSLRPRKELRSSKVEELRQLIAEEAP